LQRQSRTVAKSQSTSLLSTVPFIPDQSCKVAK
jgi:hypothetical protein